MRPAGPDDRAWLAGLDLGENERGARVVWRDAARVGAVRLDNDGAGVMHIERLEICADDRGQGIGTVVLRALDEEAARAGDALEVRIPHGNRARGLLERLGFRVLSEDAEQAVLRRG